MNLIEYLTLLIEQEKKDKKEGYEKKIQILNEFISKIDEYNNQPEAPNLFSVEEMEQLNKDDSMQQPQNDFIFAIVLEEMGLIGGIFVLSLYFIIIYRGIKNGTQVDNYFLKFLSIGISISLAIQVFINVGVVVGLLPVTGITLPLFSYGGSSLLITMFQMGILLSISKYRN